MILLSDHKYNVLLTMYQLIQLNHHDNVQIIKCIYDRIDADKIEFLKIFP